MGLETMKCRIYKPRWTVEAAAFRYSITANSAGGLQLTPPQVRFFMRRLA